jgi:hypothetical protein
MTTSKSSTSDKELTDLITSRQDALHNVDYTPLASRHDVGGTCSTLLTSSLIRDGGAAVTSEAAAAVMEGRLTTPKLDISGLHGRRYDGDDKLAGELLIICITDERSRAHIDVEFFLNVSMFVACSAKINLSRNNQLMWH